MGGKRRDERDSVWVCVYTCACVCSKFPLVRWSMTTIIAGKPMKLSIDFYEKCDCLKLQHQTHHTSQNNKEKRIYIYKESSHLSPVSLSLSLSSSLVVQSFLQTSENHRISSPIFISHLFFVHRIAPAPSQPTYAQSTWNFFRIATTKMVTIVMIITILVYCYEGQRERISEPRFKSTRTTSLQGAPYQ